MKGWGDNILKRYTNPEFYEEASGDLEELFIKESSKGSRIAGLRFFLRSLEAAISYRLQNKKKTSNNYLPMLINYLRIAFRSLLRHKGYATINLLGLAIGLASSVLITLFIWNESGYDTFHSNSKNIYRVTKRLQSGIEENLGTVPFPLAYTLQEEFGRITAAKFLREIEPVVKVDDHINLERNFFFADPSVFDIFDFRLQEGNGKDILNDPNSIILSQEAAERYFGSANPIGKDVTFRKWSREVKYIVGGILEKIPAKSHIKIDFLAKYESPNNLWDAMHGKDWYFAGGAYTYILFESLNDVQRMREFFPDFVKSHFPESVKEKVQLDIQPLESIHLHSKLDNELEVNGDIATNWILGIIGLLILIVACINFMNLSTARYTIRTKEVGVRKVLGAQRDQLVTQFMGEALLINFIALLISLVIVWIALPYFNMIIDKPIIPGSLTNNDLLLPVSILMIGLLAGVISGSYPAFFLSSFNPVYAMKSGKGSNDKGNIRKLLVMFQFAISMILLVSLLIISDQISFMKNKDLGFESNQVVLIDASNLVMPDRNTLKNALSGHSGICLVSGGWMIPGTMNFQPSIGLFAISGMESTTQMATARVDPQFFSLFGMNLVSGRSFSLDEDATNSVILNEAAAKSLGKDNESVLGIEMALYDMLGNLMGKRTVIGVIRDFNYESLHNPIKPLVLGMHANPGYLTVKVSSTEAVDYIREQWRRSFPEVPLTLNFIDDQTQSFYKKEENLAGLMKGFAGIALLIGALGLFSLASFTTERRYKEIGIRKVLGASRGQILALVLSDFQRIVLIGLVASIPIGYVAMEYWLRNFAYRVEINLMNFAIAGSVAMLVVIVSVIHRSWDAASLNPANTLKTE